MRIVRGIVGAVEQVGVSKAELLRAAQLDPAQFEHEEACVSRSVVYSVCEAALDLTRDPAFALHWSERLSESTFNPVSHLIAHAATLRRGFESLGRFHRLLSAEPSFRLSEHGDQVTVQCFAQDGASLRVQRFATEMMAFGVVRLIRSFSAQARVDAVSFEYARPEYHVEYTRVFRVAPTFEQPLTGIVFNRSLMDVVSPNRDEDVHDALRVVAEKRIQRVLQQAPVTARVRALLVEQTPTLQPNMNSVARTLGLSRRLLRRRLMAEGSSYKVIVKEALAIVAKRYLRDRGLSIQETAYEMGFADSSAFHRAFKRWTGKTPSAYREMSLDQTA